MVQAVDISGMLQSFNQLGQSRSVRQQRREQKRQQRAQKTGAMVGLLAGGATFAATGGNPALAGLAASAGQMAGTTAAGGPAPSPTAVGQLGLGVAGVQQQQAAAALQQQVGQEVGAAISPPAVTPPVQPEQQRFEPLSQAIPGLAPIVPSAPTPVRAPSLPPGAIQGAAPPPNIPAALAAQAKIDPGLALKLAVQREGAGGGAAARFNTLTPVEAKQAGFSPGSVIQQNVNTGKFSVAAKGGAGGAGLSPQQRSVQTTKLRTEFTGLSKDFIQVRDSWTRIQQSSKDPSPAGDLALIFNYMKVLDPGSTVREGEFATAEQSRSLPAGVVAKYNKVIRGERLDPDQRNDFVNRAGKLYDGQLTHQKGSALEYERFAKQMGIDPKNVITDFARVPEEDDLKNKYGLE